MARTGTPGPYIAVKNDHKQGAEVEPAPWGRPPKGLTRRQRMAQKLEANAGKEIYKLQGQIVEVVFGQIKGSFQAIKKTNLKAYPGGFFRLFPDRSCVTAHLAEKSPRGILGRSRYVYDHLA